MSDTPEVKLKKKLKALYKECGVLLVQPIGTVFTQAGVHDHILCVRGAFVSVEVKAGKKGPTLPQLMFGRMVRRSGGFAFCVNECTFDRFAAALREAITCGSVESTAFEFDMLQLKLESAQAYADDGAAGARAAEGVHVFDDKEEDEE